MPAFLGPDGARPEEERLKIFSLDAGKIADRSKKKIVSICLLLAMVRVPQRLPFPALVSKVSSRAGATFSSSMARGGTPMRSVGETCHTLSRGGPASFDRCGVRKTVPPSQTLGIQ